MRSLSELLRRRPIIIVLALGALVRLIFLLSYIFSPEWDQLLVDSLFHDRWAISIASGNVVGNDAFFRAPLYIYILGGLYALFGHSLLVARIFGHLVGLLSVLITYFLAVKVFSRKVGIIAGVIHALYPIAVYFESELLVDSLFTMLVELSILTLLLANDKKQSRWYFLGGLILGLAAITRPLIIALVPLYMIWVFLPKGPARERVLHSLVLLAAAILMILPVTLRNLSVADDFVVVSSSGGVNFFIGNNEEADGLSASMPEPYGSSWEIKDVRYLAEKETGRKLSASQISDYWFDRGLDWIAANKADFLRLYLKKLYFCVNSFEISNNRNLTQFFSNFPVLKITPINFGLIFSFAVLGAVLMVGSRTLDQKALFIILFTGLYFLTVSFFFVNARFRFPAVPYAIILASYGLGRLASAVYRRKLSVILLIAVFLGAGALVLSTTNFYNVKKDYLASGYINKANYYFYNGDFDRAIEHYHLALADDPYCPGANLNLGAVFLKKGQGDSADFYFRKELEISPGNAKAYSNLASLAYLNGDYKRAERLAEQAIDLKPYFIDPYLLSFRIYSAQDDTAAFENKLTQALEALGANARVFLDAGLIYSEWGLYEKAAGHLRMVLEVSEPPVETDDKAFNYTRAKGESLDNLKARAAHQLGYIYGIQDQIAISIEMSNLAIALDSSLVEAYINLINAYLIAGETGKARDLIRHARLRFPDNNMIEILADRLK